MKKLIFKSLSFIICTLFILQLTPIIPPQIASAITSGYYNYTLIGDNVRIDAYTGTEVNITIPETIDGYTVTSIGENAFRDCFSLTSVTIPDSVTNIGNHVFSNCFSLTTIDIGSENTAYSSMDGILYDKLKTTLICYPACKTDSSFTVLDSVTNIGDEAFIACSNLTSINIPNSVISIGRAAFMYCDKLMGVTIPDSVTNINELAFNNCSRLKKIDVGGNNATYSSADGILYDKFKTTLMCYPIGKLDSSFTVPSSVMKIQMSAFENCKTLTNVTIPDSVNSIGNRAFEDCLRLTNVNIPNSLTSIGDCMFLHCIELRNVSIPNSVTGIGDRAFENCSSLTNVNIPNSVTSIGSGIFSRCTSLTNVTIPSSVTRITSNMFYFCTSLTNVVIPKSITNIGCSAFENCTSLTNVTIPDSVTRIQFRAFVNCTRLTEAKFFGNAPTIDEYHYPRESVFQDCASNFKIYYLYGKIGFTNTWYGHLTEPFYIVNYDGNGSTSGTIPSDSSTYLESEQVTVRGNSGSLAKIGYTFAGWNTAADGNGTDYAVGTIFSMGTENVALYAKWTINNYTVTFNSQGGNLVTSKTADYNSLITAPVIPTKEGYTFGSWYKEAGCINAWGFTTDKVTANTTLYAKWTINNHTVTFNSQGGSLVTSKTADYNSLITAPAIPTKEGYTFGGWYKEAGCINAWDFTTDKVTANATLYAKWIPQVQRLAGVNRIETSIAVAKEQYTDKAPDAVVLATANDFADALAGSGLAYKYNAPLLLVDKTVNVSKRVLDYITINLSQNKNIYILGGTGAVSKEISDYLTTNGYKIIRLGGKDRYETNQKIVDYLNTPKGTSIVIATGSNFADALSISSIADIKGFPILLNGKDNLSASVSNDITNLQPTTVYIIGGTGVLSTNIEMQIKKLNENITIVRLGGKDRYETSIKIIEYFNLTTSTITVATGIDFPDALSGSVLAARKNCNVLLVDNKNITKQKDLLNKQKITNVVVFGGEGVISNDILISLIQK